MSVEAQKLEIIEWISKLQNNQIIQEILKLREKEDFHEPSTMAEQKFSERNFEDGKHIFTYVAKDFNEPLEDFKEYME